MAIIKHLPNFITCLNLFSGTIALTYAVQGDLKTAAYFILLAAIFDFMDGLLARALNAYSEIGKQLDSLADMVSFGLIPGVFVYMMLKSNLEAHGLPEILSYGGFIITVFSALRLAKFNIDTRQTENFIGLATPANTLFFVSLPFIYDQGIESLMFLTQPLILLFLTIGFSYLLVSELSLFSLKFKSLSWSQNNFRYILLVLSLLLIILFKFAAVPMIIVLYILLSIIFVQKFKSI
jgi:CDP-diacylglycerol--serine O-phosphatidyltransferase